MSKLIILSIVFLFFQCGKNDINKTTITHDLDISSTDSTYVIAALDTLHGKDFAIVLNSIKDGRCPKGVQCVWEGDAFAQLSLVKDESTEPFELHTHRKYQPDTILNGYYFKLMSVTPYPVYEEKQPDKEIQLAIWPNTAE